MDMKSFYTCSLEAVKALNRAFSKHFNIFLMTDRQTDRPTDRRNRLLYPALRMRSRGVTTRGILLSLPLINEDICLSIDFQSYANVVVTQFCVVFIQAVNKYSFTVSSEWLWF